MNIEMVEQIKQQWLFAADAMPQLICLIDRGGRIIRANRTLERWGLGQVEAIRGTHLHDALHRHCSDPACYLRLFLQDNATALARDGRALCSAWDSLLERHFDIRIQMPVQEDGADLPASFAVAAIDDVTESRRLSAQHLTIQESERRRIALDLHDGLGQTLSLVKLSVEEAARSARDGAPGKTAAALERLAPTVKSALAELRRLSMNLRPATLDDLGILATLAWYFREFEAACPNIRLERDISVKESDVAELLKIAIFRIVQEATGNALKHAGAKRVKVSLSNEGDCLELLIEDTGRGFDPAAVAAKRDFEHGLGLQSMKERAELSGASYEIRSAPGQGTSICVRWPSPRALERNLAAMSPTSIRFLHPATRVDRPPPERYSPCPVCMKRMAGQ